jgi:hypothetical protein
MSAYSLFFGLVAMLFVGGCYSPKPDVRNPAIDVSTVNAILGDESYFDAFGTAPSALTDEDLRLKTHLAYVERLLRKRIPENLNEAQAERRAFLLDLLSEYHQGGTFPRNHDYPDQRIPCFIDRDGRICAVGYLIEQTAGRPLAEAINSKWQYAYVHQMDDPAIDAWIVESGLSREECAMIQPAYGPPPGANTNTLERNYAIGTSVFTGLNSAMSAVNAIQLHRGEGDLIAPIAGMVSGASQLTLGLVKYPQQDDLNWGTQIINPTERNASMLNIGLGAGTLVISTFNLITNRKPKERKLSWNVYGMPAPDQTTAVGLGFTKRF